MSDLAIRVDNLSKLYHIGKKQEKYRTLRDTIAEAFISPFKKAGSLIMGQASAASNLNEIIWALKDVSFEVKQGEVVGIIGRNGAGKSTLLKILSRITEPTKGFAEIHGRVGSLLEVGTGFHAELTGRENIYLNGAILGMRKTEIDKKFDEIVAFAEVEKFIDTPVKHYSSGMYLRLAFAVAAHLEPEILLVDEVLAVGDLRFQKKCLNKMEEVGKKGRTVLFVSHNMPAITRLCKRAILLNEGRILDDGPSHKVIHKYLNEGMEIRALREWAELENAPGDQTVRLCAVRARTEDGKITDTVLTNQAFCLEIEYEVLKPGNWLIPNFNLYNEDGLKIFTTMDIDPEWRQRPRPIGRYVSTAWIPGNLLSEGKIFINAAMMTPQPFIAHFSEHNAISIQVIDDMGVDSARGDWTGYIGGVVRPLLKWTTSYSPKTSLNTVKFENLM
ncbi:MAG: ABC transporter ATP-binding protein [Cytophagaceae bacterium]